MHKLIHNVKNGTKKGMLGGWKLFGKNTNLSVWSVNTKTKTIKEYKWKDLLKRELML